MYIMQYYSHIEIYNLVMVYFDYQALFQIQTFFINDLAVICQMHV